MIPGRGKGMSAPLRHRQFRLLFSGQLVSNLGDWLDFLALAVLIAYVWHKGPASLAALAIVIAVPWIVVAPFAGVLADRWPKRALMIGADLARAAIVTGYVFAPDVGVLLVLVGLKTVCSTLFSPAEQATIRIVVPEEQLHAANALAQLVVQSTKVIGPTLGGLLVAISSPRTAFAVDAATFVCSAAILSRLGPISAHAGQVHDEEADDFAAGGIWRELVEGTRYIASRPALLTCIASFSAATFLLLAFDSLSPLAFRQLGVSRALFGIAIASIGLGGVVGATAVGRLAADINPFILMGGGSVIVGGLVSLMGAALLTKAGVSHLVWAPVLLAVGVASAGVLIAVPTIIQRETPPELMGRVSATATSVPTVFQLAGPIVGAAVASWQGIGFTFIAAGGGLAGIGGIVMMLRPAVGVGVGVAGGGEAQRDLDAHAGSPDEPALGTLTEATTKRGNRLTHH